MDLPVTWRLIAESEVYIVGEGGRSRWVSIEGAGMTVSEARKLHEAGLLLMAQQRLASGKMGLVVKVAKNGSR